MAAVSNPITLAQVQELARKLTTEDRRALLDALLAERFDATLAEADRARGPQPDLTDAQIQNEIDMVRSKRREDRQRAPERHHLA